MSAKCEAAADPRLGRLAMRLLEFGYSPAKVLQELRSHDPDFQHRRGGAYSLGTVPWLSTPAAIISRVLGT